MGLKNCPDCCFMGDIDDDMAYPLGCPTKEEADRLYAKKETESKVSDLEKNKADKINVYSKSEIDDKLAHMVVDAYTKAETDEKLSEKADNASLQSLEGVVNTKANESTVNALAQTVEQKADKADIPDLGLVVQGGLLCCVYESEV